MGVVVVGLVVSGLTALPLHREVSWLAGWLGAEDPAAGGLRGWLATVRVGLEQTYAAYPWIAYGTDWLAFGHLVIALFFVGPMLWPRRDHRWLLVAGMIACVAVLPMAAVAGQVRGIPWGWRLIDMAFGVVGVVPMIWGYVIHRRVLERGGGPGRA